MKTSLATKTNSTTPTVKTEFMAYFAHIENSMVFYKTLPKGGSRTAKSGKLVFKLQDLPLGFRLKPVHPTEELEFLME